MNWEHIDSGRVNELPLDLYRSGRDYMIRVDGLELMNSRWHRSEAGLAQAASWSASKLHPRILIGGLGLGYTLAACLREFGNDAEIAVAEQSSDVLRWYRSYFQSECHGLPDDSGVRFFNEDVRKVIADEPPFDLILLDVDNGPEPVSGEANRALYTKGGLETMHARLREKGALLLWSAFESHEFERTARDAGFDVICVPLNVGLREHQHYIYCCFRGTSQRIRQHEFLQAACYDGYASDYQDDVAFLEKWLGGARRVLEIGVGTGRLALKLAKNRELYFGIDTSAPMLRQLRKKIGDLPIQVRQASMFEFELNERFDRILFPFRVLSYAPADEFVTAALERARTHLTPDGRVLLNMLDFGPDFVERWQNKAVSCDFTGPDGEIWTKTDVMRFEESIMYRKIQLRRAGVLISENEDDLMWMSAERIRLLCEKAGLTVLNVWPAYQWTEYPGRDEYVLEASARS